MFCCPSVACQATKLQPVAHAHPGEQRFAAEITHRHTQALKGGLWLKHLKCGVSAHKARLESGVLQNTCRNIQFMFSQVQ